MTVYELEIEGNQDDCEGNPIPYHRTTQRGTWDKAARRYAAWKEFVQFKFAKEYGVADLGKPIQGSPRGKIHVGITFKGENHGDPDNIVKGILDALFKNDKEMDVETTHRCAEKRGSVKVRIEIPKTA